MKKLLLSAIAASCCVACVGLTIQTADAGVVDTDIASYPLNAVFGAKQPLIMLMLGRDHSMYYEAYNDLTDLDEDGSVDGVFTPHIIYDGIFESNWCYQYTDNMFKMSRLASANANDAYKGKPVYKCSGGLWSGNFLNYITSSRMDVVKRILIGGQRYTNLDQCKNNTMKTNGSQQFNTCRDSSGYPILSRQYIPHDTHGWAKSYHKDDINERCAKYGYSCSLDNWAPIGDESAMFGSVGRQLLVAKATDIYSGTGMNMGSYKCLSSNTCSDADSIFVWNWVARESGAFGDTNSGAKGPLSISGGKTAMNKPGVTSNSNHFSVSASQYNVVVQACNYAADPNATMPSRCQSYGNESNKVYNTVGLLQQFSKEGAVDAYFGLTTAIWNTDVAGKDAKKKAALRSPIADLSTSSQINLNNGDFKENSVYALIDLLTLGTNEGTPTSTAGGSTSNNWKDCAINSNNDVTTPQRGCSDWGNPLAPLIQKSYEYFANIGVNDAGSDKLAVKRFTDDQQKLDFDYVRLSIASANANNAKDANKMISTFTPYQTFDYCYRPINFILADENISMDYNLDAVTNLEKASIIKGFEYIKNREGKAFTGNHIFGELTGAKSMNTGETIHTFKNVDSDDKLLEVRGVSTLEPNLQGSLKGAALAAYLHNNPLSFDFTSDAGVQKKNVPGFEHFAVAMSSYLPQFEVYAKNGKKVLIVPTCKAPRRPWSATIDGIGTYSYDPEDQYTSNCAVADVFYVNSSYSTTDEGEKLTSLEFRVTYEDNEAGSDFDMDALFTYKVWADEQNKNLVNVSITGFYHDTYAGQIGGYSIFGTKGVITPNYSNCNSSSCSISSTGYVVNNKNFYLDMMKVDQNSNQYTLMRSFSDPYNEYNNVRGFDPDHVVDTSSDLEDKVNVVSIGAPESTDGSHRSKCLSADKILDKITGYVYKHTANNNGMDNYVKFLPSFSSACLSTVSRKFYVDGFNENSGFYDSPLSYAAYYGSRYGESGSRADRLVHNPNYFYVTNAAKLASQLTTALTNAVGSGGKSGTGLSFPTVDLTNSNEAITATYDTAYWTGALHRNSLKYNKDGSVNVKSTAGSAWENDSVKFDTASKVLIADKTGNLKPLTSSLLLSNSSKYPLADAIIDQLGMGDCDTDKRNELIQRYVAYVVDGDGTWEYLGDEATMDNTGLSPRMTCGTTTFYGFHARSEGHKSERTLGAIINSTPQFYTVADGRKIIFAANDGMVHIVDEATGHVDYSIIPFVSQNTMPKYSKPGNADHLINDGVMSVFTYKVKSSSGSVKRVLAIGALGAVHPGVYAFDLTAAPKMLWELSPEYARLETSERVRNLPALGAIKSKIKIVPYKIADTNYLYAVFGNGYNSADGLAGIAVVNALTGKVLSKNPANPRSKGGILVNSYGWSEPKCDRDADAYVDYRDEAGNCYKNGMNEVLLYDSNFDDLLDYIYATDLYGNVYRVRTTSSVDGWHVSHIHTTVTPEDTTTHVVKIQPITTAPSLAKDANGDPMVIVGTGKYLGASDLKTGDIQSVWALSDRDFASSSDNDSDSTSILCADEPTNLKCYRSSKLFNQKLRVDTSGTLGAGFRSYAPVEGSYDVDHYQGWVTDFATVGNSGISERIRANMLVMDRHLYVITVTPSASECDGGGSGNWYDMNVTNSNFYVSAMKSQSFSERMYTEMTMAFASPNDTNDYLGTGTTDPYCEGDSCVCTGDDCRGVNPGCVLAGPGVGQDEGGGEIFLSNQYCPRIESWQAVYD